jgi:NAD(P)-dependent dehydrogenase (short-subunit alcohol dehydrogenase family)
MASALSLADKTFIVTGANSGLGFETAKALARQDAHVIFAVKTKAKGDDAIRHVQEVATKRAKLECMQVDLASFRYSQLRVVLIRPEAGAYALVHVCSFP